MLELVVPALNSTPSAPSSATSSHLMSPLSRVTSRNNSSCGSSPGDRGSSRGSLPGNLFAVASGYSDDLRSSPFGSSGNQKGKTGRDLVGLGFSDSREGHLDQSSPSKSIQRKASARLRNSMDKARSFVRGSNNYESKNITPKPSWSGIPDSTQAEDDLAMASFKTFTRRRSRSLPGKSKRPSFDQGQNQNMRDYTLDPRFENRGGILEAETSNNNNQQQSSLSWSSILSSSKKVQRLRSDMTLKKETSSRSLSEHK